MNLKRDVVQPIGIGAAVFVAMNIAGWILSIFGLSPTVGTAALNATPAGIIGLVGTLWVAGKAAEVAPRLVRTLLGR